MKIVMVSIPSLHFFRWVNQLEESGHEVYWFDIAGMSKTIPRIDWVSQKTNWKLKWDYPGRTFIKNRFPKLYRLIQKFNENNTEKVFEEYIQEIEPDVVHSFALYLSCSPIQNVMNRNASLKWIYSSWGSDLFYFQNKPNYLKDIKSVLPRINYLFTDCKRDYEIAKQYGFTGEFLGVFPGGGGFDLKVMEEYRKPLEERKTILIKGFQGRSGRAITVLQAIELLQKELIDFEIKVFGSDKEIFEFVSQSNLKNWNNFQVIGKVSHNEVLQLMGESLIYIGNSNSDGMPNTLLEAICMGVFPIQSNPGGASAEIIEPNLNGLLIEDCESKDEIKNKIIKTITTVNFEEASNQNLKICLNFDYFCIKNLVIDKYKLNEKN